MPPVVAISHVAIEDLKCNLSEQRSAARIKYRLDFRDLVWKIRKVVLNNFEIDYMMQWKYFGYVQWNISPICHYFFLMWLLEIFQLNIWLAFVACMICLLYRVPLPNSLPFLSSFLTRILRSSCLVSSDLLTYFMPRCQWSLSLCKKIKINLLFQKVLNIEANITMGKDHNLKYNFGQGSQSQMPIGVRRILYRRIGVGSNKKWWGLWQMKTMNGPKGTATTQLWLMVAILEFRPNMTRSFYFFQE